METSHPELGLTVNTPIVHKFVSEIWGTSSGCKIVYDCIRTENALNLLLDSPSRATGSGTFNSGMDSPLATTDHGDATRVHADVPLAAPTIVPKKRAGGRGTAR